MELCKLLNLEKPTKKEFSEFKKSGELGEAMSEIAELLPFQTTYIRNCKFTTTNTNVGMFLMIYT